MHLRPRPRATPSLWVPLILLSLDLLNYYPMTDLEKIRYRAMRYDPPQLFGVRPIRKRALSSSSQASYQSINKMSLQVGDVRSSIRPLLFSGARGHLR